MGLTIAFTFLVIAALAAPFLWVLWWGAGSLTARRTPRAVAVAREAARPLRPTRTVARYDRPHAADIGLPGRADAVTVCRATDGAEIEICHGPDRAGRCPRIFADGSVPCAGMVLALPRPVRGSTEWHIPAGYGACMLGGYGAFRQAASSS